MSTPLSVRSQIRANVLAKLKGLVPFPVDVTEVGWPADLFMMASTSGLRVGICRTGGDVAPKDEGGGEWALFAPGSQMRYLEFALSVLDDIPAKPNEALNTRLEDLGEYLVKGLQLEWSGHADDIGVPGVTGRVKLYPLSEQVIPHPKRAAGETGGPLALVYHFRTSVFEL